MGGSKKTETTNNVVESKVPQWVSDAGQQTYNNASNWIANNPVQPYSGQRAAPATANQNAASTMARDTANAGQSDLDAARALTSQAANGTYQPITTQAWDSAQAQKYASPFASAVRDNTLREMDRNNLIQQRQVDDQAQAAHAFGGDRQSILMAQLMKDQNTGRTNYIDQANQEAYLNAQGQFNQDRAAQTGVDQFNAGIQQQGYDRQLAAGGQYGQLGTTAGGLASRGVNGLLTTGLVDQDVQQRALDAQYQDYLRTQQQPLDQYAQLGGILAGTPINRTQNTNGTTTQTSSGGLGSTLLGIAQIGASIYSDRRLKRDIVKIGELAKGVGIYTYNYLWPSVRQVGVMADEVARHFPQAIESGPNGYSKVNYGKLMEAVA